jgi:hypothetical protein
MSPSKQSRQAVSKDASFPQNCRAELIFYAQTRTDPFEPAKVLGEYPCDYARQDWERRWTEWNSHRNPYVHLFLCREHAKKLGLIP